MNVAWSPLCIALWMLNPTESYLGLETGPEQFFQDDDVVNDEHEGLRVTSTTENSPARQAGFQPGDVLLTLNGERPRNPMHLEKMVAALSIGSRIEAEVLRGDLVIELSAVTVARLVPRETPPVKAYIERDRLGVVVEDLSAESASRAGVDVGSGARIKRYLKSSPLLDSELLVGDVVVEMNGEPVHGGADFLALSRDLEPDTEVHCLVSRDGERTEVIVTTRDPAGHLSKFYFPLIVDYERNSQQEETEFGLLPFNMLKYERRENERSYCLFWFICVETGTNELLVDWQE